MTERGRYRRLRRYVGSGHSRFIVMYKHHHVKGAFLISDFFSGGCSFAFIKDRGTGAGMRLRGFTGTLGRRSKVPISTLGS